MTALCIILPQGLELAESWINGNRRAVVDVVTIDGRGAAALAVSIIEAFGRDDDHAADFAAAVRRRAAERLIEAESR